MEAEIVQRSRELDRLNDERRDANLVLSEYARRARAAIGSATRLVAFTGSNSPAVRAAALEAGFDMDVSKPCTAERLGEILRSTSEGSG